MIQPLRDLVLIKPDETVKQTASGILLNEEWKSHPMTGEVVAIGDTVTRVKVGDRIVFERYATRTVDEYRLCKEGCIFALINETA